MTLTPAPTYLEDLRSKTLMIGSFCIWIVGFFSRVCFLRNVSMVCIHWVIHNLEFTDKTF